MCTRVSVCDYIHIGMQVLTDRRGCQKRVQVVVTCLTLVLGLKAGPLHEQYVLLAAGHLSIPESLNVTPD